MEHAVAQPSPALPDPESIAELVADCDDLPPQVPHTVVPPRQQPSWRHPDALTVPDDARDLLGELPDWG